MKKLSIETVPELLHLKRFYRRDRLMRRCFALMIFSLLFLLSVLSGYAFVPDKMPAVLVLLSLFFGILFLTLLVFWFQPIDAEDFAREVDRHGRLPDSVLTLLSLSEGNVSWIENQQQQTRKALEEVDWKLSWPRCKYRLERVLSPIALALLGIVLGIGLKVESEREIFYQVEAQKIEEKVKHLEEAFKQWKSIPDEEKSEEFKKFLEEVKPIQEKLKSGEITERELLVQMNRLEERLEKIQQELRSQSLEGMASDLATALELMSGTGALSASLQRKDFEQAQKEAETLAQRFEKGEVTFPAEENAKEMANRLSSLASKSPSSQSSSKQGLQQMSQALQNRESQSMRQGLMQLSKGFCQECQNQRQRNLCKQCNAQLRFCKSCRGGDGISMGLPQLSLSKEKGKGAGIGVDLNRVGNPTGIEVSLQKSQLQGAIGEGETEVSTEKSNESQKEFSKGGRVSISAQEYQKMSREAVEDESIPLPKRQVIKKYFENIRTTEENL